MLDQSILEQALAAPETAPAAPAAPDVPAPVAPVQVLHPQGSLYQLRWTPSGPVDVFVSARPDASPAAGRLVAAQVRTGAIEARIPDIARPYFILRAADGRIERAAERLLPLEGGSNFRDLGGYPAADGKQVRWGLIYRSAAMPKLTVADDAYLGALHVRTIVDLRSTDERQLSPTDWDAKPEPRYVTVDYPGDVIFSRLRAFDGPEREAVTERLYAQLPQLMRPEYRDVFGVLLSHAVPMVICDSDGQDRTGIAAALVLGALGVPRAVIDADYLLSVEDRRPENEMADVDLAKYASTNAEARFLIAYRNYADSPEARRQNDERREPPLRDARGRPLLDVAFDAIERDYGSVPAYLDHALGVTAQDVAKLRAYYLVPGSRGVTAASMHPSRRPGLR